MSEQRDKVAFLGVTIKLYLVNEGTKAISLICSILWNCLNKCDELHYLTVKLHNKLIVAAVVLLKGAQRSRQRSQMCFCQHTSSREKRTCNTGCMAGSDCRLTLPPRHSFLFSKFPLRSHRVWTCCSAKQVEALPLTEGHDGCLESWLMFLRLVSLGDRPAASAVS